jgi:hypothetical protein
MFQNVRTGGCWLTVGEILHCWFQTPITLGAATEHYQYPVPETQPGSHGTEFDTSPTKYSPPPHITPRM